MFSRKSFQVRISRLSLGLVLLLVCTRVARAQVCGKLDDGAVHRPPYYTGTLPVPRPGFRQTIYDIGFGCPIRRISDDGANTASAPISWFNKDGSLILISTEHNYIIDRKGNVARTALSTGLSCSNRVFFWMHPRWSSTDPFKIYFHSNPMEDKFGSPPCKIVPGNPATYKNKIYVYDVAHNVSSELSLTVLSGRPVSDYPFVKFGEGGIGWDTTWAEADVSANGDYMVLAGSLSTDGMAPYTKFRILNLSTGEVGDEIQGSPSDPFFGVDKLSVDWCEVTPISHNILCRFDYAPVPSSPQEFHRFELFKGFAGTYRGVAYASGQYIGTVSNWNGHADRGIDVADTDGDGSLDEILVVANSTEPRDANGNGCVPPGVEKIRIPDGHRTCLLDNVVTGSFHVSVNNALAAGGAASTHPWALVSTYANQDGEQKYALANNWENKWNVHDNELVLVRLDGSEARSLAHHRIRTDEAYGGASYATLSPDGASILFNTNFGTQANDVYLLPTGAPCNNNGLCETGETRRSCPADCPGTPICGNGVCEAGEGESSITCSSDCRSGCGPVTGQGQLCSQGMCNSGGYTCSDLHDQGFSCGDGACSAQESTATCALDCPAAPPACPGGIASTGSVVVFPQPRQIFLDGPGSLGDNYLEIPAFSPVNDFPTDGLKNGFQQLCDLFGLRGSTSSIYQNDAAHGNIHVFNCNQQAAPDFFPCQGVVIRPSGVTGPIWGTIPVGHDPGGFGVEGSWRYTSYPDAFGPLGDNLFGIPLTVLSTTPSSVCQQLSLPSQSQLFRISADTGQSFVHACGQVDTFPFVPGEAVMIRTAPGSSAVEGSVAIQ